MVRIFLQSDTAKHLINILFDVVLVFVALGETNEAFYRNIYTGQQLPIAQQRSQLRPHRPAPVPDFSQIQNRVLNSSAATAAAVASSSSIPQPTL